ncbi:MAG: beta-lactamase family protein [Flavobacteriales bacterium]|nr:beta-lactamase family protein [Flavobacteriales bacterium]
MKKTGTFGLSLLLLLFIGFYFFLYPKLEIVSGYNAKILCSCLFVSGFDQETAEEIDLGFGPLWLASNNVDVQNKVVRTSVLGLHPKIAIYRDGLGCSLINDREKPEINLATIKISDKSGWPNQPVVENEKLQEVLMKAFDSNGERMLNTRAVLVLKNGELKGEVYAKGIMPNTPLLGWSMSKTLTAIMAGVLAKDGYWNLESPLPVESWIGTDREKITLTDALNMKTGLEWIEDYGSVSTATKMLYSSNNMGLVASENSLEFEPGTKWKYSSGTTNILSFAMANAFSSEAEYLSFPYKRILKPIGAETFVFETDASGHYVGSSYGYASARDWAKLGQLLLNEGNMYGEQIIDSTWVDFMTTPVKESNGIYGGQLWFPFARGQEGYEPIDYTLDGFQGQIVSILPSEDMVIVRLGVMYDEANFDFGAWVKQIREVLG